MSCSSYLVMLFVGVVVLTTTQFCVCDPYYTTTSPTTNDHKLPPNPFLNHPKQHKPPLPVLLLQQPPHDRVENPQSEHNKPPTLPARHVLIQCPPRVVTRPLPGCHGRHPPANVASSTPPLA